MVCVKTVIVAFITGLTQYRLNTREIEWTDGRDEYFTVEVLNGKKEMYVIRKYWDNGIVKYERRTKRGVLHGRYISYFTDGKVYWKKLYKDGQELKFVSYKHSK